MRTLFTTVIIGLLASATSAQSEAASNAQSAQDVLAKALETYAAADVITDTITLTYDTPGGTESTEMELTVAAAGSSRFQGQGMILTAADGQLYLQTETLPSKYYQAEIQQDVPTTLTNLFGGSGLPFHYQAIDEMTVDELVQTLNFGGVQGLEFAGVSEITTDDGETLTQVKLSGANDAVVNINVDPKTNLIEQAKSTFTPQSGARGMPAITVAMDFHPKLMDTLPQPITFETEGRTRVSSTAELALGEGDPAPNFTLESSKGGTVSLEELKGKVVVLDFWATWCAPCKMGLPLLEQFHQWTQENDKPIRVLAVNGGQREQTAAARNEAALNYWKAQEFTMPTLLDPESETFGKYVAQGIPLTVIIDQKGNIAAMHTGYDPNMVEKLKKETTELLEQSETTG